MRDSERNALHFTKTMKKQLAPIYAEVKKLDSELHQKLETAKSKNKQLGVDPTLEGKLKALNKQVAKFKASWSEKLNALKTSANSKASKAVNALKKRIVEMQHSLKKNLAIITASLLLFAAPAFAYEESCCKPFCWTGYYIGVHGGFTTDFHDTSQKFFTGSGEGVLQNVGSSDRRQNLSVHRLEPGEFLPDDHLGIVKYASSPKHHDDSHRLLGAYGGEISYMWQCNHVVKGVTADYTSFEKQHSYTWSGSGLGDFTPINGEAEPKFHMTSAAQGSSKIRPDWLSTARVNWGISCDRLLWYMTGGFAFGEAKARASAKYSENLTVTEGIEDHQGFVDLNVAFDNELNWKKSKTKTYEGYAFGGGANYALTNCLIFKVEGLYYNLGTMKLKAPGTFGGNNRIYNAPTWGEGVGDSFTGSTKPLRISKKLEGILLKVGAAVKF